MNANITIKTTIRQDDATGEDIIRFTPVLTAGSLGKGEISLAYWESGLFDGQLKMESRKNSALKSAKESVAAIAKEVGATPDPSVGMAFNIAPSFHPPFSHDQINEIVKNPSTSFWLKNAIATAMQRDSLDAVRDTETLLRVVNSLNK